MADKCLIRIEDALSRSGINTDEANGILQSIRQAESQAKLKDADDAVNAVVAREILDKKKLDKQINKLNAIEDEIKIRDYVEWNLANFKDNPTEGMTAVLVGSNWERMGARDSVAAAQDSYYKNLVVTFNEKLKDTTNGNPINGGFFVFRKEFLELIPDDPKADLEKMPMDLFGSVRQTIRSAASTDMALPGTPLMKTEDGMDFRAGVVD